MRPGTLAVILGHRRQQVSQTFTANATFTAPFTTSSIDTASGKGANGGTASGGTTTQWRTVYQTIYSRRDGSGLEETVSYGPWQPGPIPAGYSAYCDPATTTPDSTVYATMEKCYDYEQQTITDPPVEYTGASTTAFGKTFPGGTGGPATTTTFSNIAVTPGASYSIVVPSGGSITITYTQ